MTTLHGEALPAPLRRASPAFAADLGRHGARPALVAADGEVLSYAGLAARVAEARAGLGPEQTLVTLAPEPTVAFVVDYLAALAGGHAVLLTRDDALARAYRPAPGDRPALHPDLRLLLSTSGSTGSPKLVRLSGDNLQSNAESIAAYLRLTADDVAITTLPLDYCYGLSVLHSHLAVGASVVLTDRSVTDAGLWAAAREHGVTSFAGVPYTFDLLAAAGWPELPTLRLVTQAGGRMAPDEVRAVAARGRRAGFELVVMYGQTEATARMAYLPPHLAAEHPAAIGVPIPGGDLRLEPVAGLADAGPDVSTGVGELVYAGRNVMMGYAHSAADLSRGPELTELHTGDLARVNDAGLFEIVGRTSRFAKIFGQRIDLDRVEALLAVDHVTAACAEAGDPERRGRLLVVAVAGPDAPGEVAARVSAATGLPAHAIAVVPVEAVPRLPNGKVDQRAVAALAVRAGPGGGADDLTAVYRAVLGTDEVAPDDTFVGLGGDSLSYVELSLQLESRLRRVPDDWPTRTIADLTDLIDLIDLTDRTAPGGRRHRRWARVETSIVLRALAIVLVVGTHTNLFLVLGGAHTLLAVAGANFARFGLNDRDTAARRRRVLRAVARVAVPTSLWVLAVMLVTGDYGWRVALLLHQALGGSSWSEPEWHFWFVEVLVHLVLVVGLLLSVPAVARLERRAPFGFAVGLLVVALGLRWSAGLVDRDVIHTSWFVAWLFVGGWAAVRATTARQRALVSVLLVAGAVGFCDDPARDALIAAGCLALVWVRSVPWPRFAVAPLAVVASSTLAIYLTHWQVYPHLEHRWPLGGLLASLAVGVAAWWLSALASSAVRRAWQRSRPHPPRPSIPQNRQKEPRCARTAPSSA